MASEKLMEELKLPEHHLLFNGNVLAGVLSDSTIDTYGTSTFLNILEKDGKFDELDNFKSEIYRLSNRIRDVLNDIFDEDDSYEDYDDKKYEGYTMFNISGLCGKNFIFNRLILLPPSVSNETFNKCYPAYQEIVRFVEDNKHNFLESSLDESKSVDIDGVDSFLSSFQPSVKKYKTSYKKLCREFIRKIKWFIREYMKDDDYIINAYKYIPINISEGCDDRLDIIFNIEKNDEIGKLCEKIMYDVTSQYQIKYNFDTVIEGGLKYKIIPNEFIFYRSYPKNDTPFPGRRPYVYLGFDFFDIIGYSAPKQITTSSHNICDLIGNVGTFKLNKELKLLDLGDPQNIKNLSELMPKSLKEGWKIENGSVIRNSNYESDADVGQWLYDNNYDGFIGYDIGKFHNEVCISRRKELEELDEPIKGMGIKFPLTILDLYPVSNMVPMCNYPFNKINYDVRVENRI